MFIGFHFPTYDAIFNASYLRCVAVEEALVKVTHRKYDYRYVPIVVYVGDSGKEYRIPVKNKHSVKKASLQDFVGTDMRVSANTVRAYYTPIWLTTIETLLIAIMWLLIVKHYINKIKSKKR